MVRAAATCFSGVVVGSAFRGSTDWRNRLRRSQSASSFLLNSADFAAMKRSLLDAITSIFLLVFSSALISASSCFSCWICLETQTLINRKRKKRTPPTPPRQFLFLFLFFFDLFVPYCTMWKTKNHPKHKTETGATNRFSPQFFIRPYFFLGISVRCAHYYTRQYNPSDGLEFFRKQKQRAVDTRLPL